ncbi:MAG TPA: hypothetical protein VMR31_07725 [Myxococcota bacterium]|nr:hypothetical protein [Myxococcota bacterium]
MKRIKSHLPLVVSFAVAGLLTASLATGTAQSAVASLVQIVNTAANPVPSQDVDNPARQPVSFETSVSVSANAMNGYAFQAYQVPAGKQLVIDYVSMNSEVQTAEQVFSISFQEEGITNLIFVPVSNVASFAANPSLHGVVAGQAVAMYVRAGDYLDVGVTTNAGAPGANVFVSWTGHLVNLP